MNNDKIEIEKKDCTAAFGTQGLTLYTFNPFTAEEWKKTDHNELVRRRQIPDDFLKKMNTHELFIQFIYMDMAKDVLLFNRINEDSVASLIDITCCRSYINGMTCPIILSGNFKR